MRPCRTTPSVPALGAVVIEEGDVCHIELMRGADGQYLLAIYQSDDPHEDGPLVCAILSPTETWELGELLESTSRTKETP